MRLLALLPVFLLAGCLATPVKRTFPEVPEDLKAACPALQKVEQGAKLSDVVTTVSANYSQYHECRTKMDAWNNWYNSQKQIFDSVK